MLKSKHNLFPFVRATVLVLICSVECTKSIDSKTMSFAQELNLLCVNLQPSTSINVAVYGNFTGAKGHEIVAAKGNNLELSRFNENGKLQLICSTPAFSIIRSLITFRLAGATRDYIVIGSDSGKIVIVEYDQAHNNWKLIHSEVFGRTGSRRIVPGQYLAADPKGRALLIASAEKQKLVYVMNRDSSNRLTISSPLEAHKAETILFAVVGVDVGFENPIFATIELEYNEADQDPTGEVLQEIDKQLVYYELDLGLNHVIRRWSEPISRQANLLFAVPGGDNGPSGVLICSENWISYKHQGHMELRAPIPRRGDLPKDRGVLIVCGAIYRKKDNFFYLFQSEFGDVYKVTIDFTLNPEYTGVGSMTVGSGNSNSNSTVMNHKFLVKDLHIAYYETIAVCMSLAITRSGLLYTASEVGNSAIYQIVRVDEKFLQAAVAHASMISEEMNEALGDDALSASKIAPIFTVKMAGGGSGGSNGVGKLSNIELIDEISSLSPLLDVSIVGQLTDSEAAAASQANNNPASAAAAMMTMMDGAGISGQGLITLSGQGERSSIRLLKAGLRVQEMASLDFQHKPMNVWTLPSYNNPSDDTGSVIWDEYLVVSFSNNTTLVLSLLTVNQEDGTVSSGNIEETTDSGLITNSSSILVMRMNDGSIVQVYSSGIRHVKATSNASSSSSAASALAGGMVKSIVDWKAPARKYISLATGNEHQVVIILADSSSSNTSNIASNNAVNSSNSNSNDLLYFELDSVGNLMEVQSLEISSHSYSKRVVCLDLMAPIPQGRIRAPWIAIGCSDDTVQLISTTNTDNDNGRFALMKGPLLPIDGKPYSLKWCEMTSTSSTTTATIDSLGVDSNNSSGSKDVEEMNLYLFIGLEKGVMQRMTVDVSTGDFSDPRQRFLGSRPVILQRMILPTPPIANSSSHSSKSSVNVNHCNYGILAMSSKNWLAYTYQQQYYCSMIHINSSTAVAAADPSSAAANVAASMLLEASTSLAYRECGDFGLGIASIHRYALKILVMEALGTLFHKMMITGSLQQQAQQQADGGRYYTPRKLCALPGSRGYDLAIIETDHNMLPPTPVAEDATAMDQDKAEEQEEAEEEEGEEGNNRVYFKTGPFPSPMTMTPPGLVSTWMSRIRLVDLRRLGMTVPGSSATKGILDLERNEAAMAITSVSFTAHSEESFLLVSIVKHQPLTLAHMKSPLVATTAAVAGQPGQQMLQPSPPKRQCFLHVYRLLPDASNQVTLQLLHKTEIEDICYAMIPYYGRLLCGVGRTLRLYDLGKKKLLKKCEYKGIPLNYNNNSSTVKSSTCIVRLASLADRIYVGDISQSVSYYKYRMEENSLVLIAQDTLPRFVTCLVVLDYATVAVGDKFGNIALLRLPENAVHEELLVGSSSTAAATAAGGGAGGLGGGGPGSMLAPGKLELLAHYYLGELPTAIIKSHAKLLGREVMIISTITGGIYALLACRSKEEATMFQQLEMFVRQEYTSITQRDHLAYRSLYTPVKNVIDIGLCERYLQLPVGKQRDFADGVDRTISEVVKKLEEIRDLV